MLWAPSPVVRPAELSPSAGGGGQGNGCSRCALIAPFSKKFTRDLLFYVWDPASRQETEGAHEYQVTGLEGANPCLRPQGLNCGLRCRQHGFPKRQLLWKTLVMPNLHVKQKILCIFSKTSYQHANGCKARK